MRAKDFLPSFDVSAGRAAGAPRLLVTMVSLSRSSFSESSGVRAALDVARQASCFMASIGTVENNATVVQTGFLNISTLDRLRARGAPTCLVNRRNFVRSLNGFRPIRVE
jgi:DNA-binding transcriptional regulator LsrR (DeoR family)